MSGRRNHILPKFLMRGFTSTTKETTWYFRNGVIPKNIGINSIGVERDYYKLNGENTIDERITTDENNYGILINKIRSTKKIQTDDYKQLNDLSFDLYIRSKHVTEEVYKSFINLTSLFFSDQSMEKVLPYITKKAFDNQLKKLAQETVRTYGQRRSIQIISTKRKQLERIFEQTGFHSMLKKALPEIFEAFSKAISEKLPKSIKKGHLEGLITRYSTDNKPESLSFISWKIFESMEEDFILGDIGPLFINGEDIHPLIWIQSKPQSVYLPISRDLILIGTMDPAEEFMTPSNINKATAYLSNNYFISSKNDNHLIDLSQSIGLSQAYLKQQNILFENWLNDIGPRNLEDH